MKLSILIPTIKSRENLFNSICLKLKNQIANRDIEIISDDSDETIGFKRNNLLDMASGEYLCFIDDDDDVSDDYIDTILDSIKNKPDCVSLKGVITWDGENPEIFEHSIKYKAYATTTNAIKYERYPNHLNCIKSEIAKKFKFPEKNHGEDSDWAKIIFDSGLIKKETYIDKIIYYYKFKRNKNESN